MGPGVGIPGPVLNMFFFFLPAVNGAFGGGGGGFFFFFFGPGGMGSRGAMGRGAGIDVDLWRGR